MMSTSEGILFEASTLPLALFRAIYENLPSLDREPQPTDRGIVIQILGATFAHPFLYTPLRNHLLRSVANCPPVFLPPLRIRNMSEMPCYQARLPKHQGMKIIYVAHSAGGYLALRDYSENPERILGIISMATPHHALRIRKEHRDMIRRVFDVDIEHLPEWLEELTPLISRKDLWDILTVIASSCEPFFPSRVCKIKGADFRQVRCSHIDFLRHPEVFRCVSFAIERLLQPRLAIDNGPKKLFMDDRGVKRPSLKVAFSRA